MTIKLKLTPAEGAAYRRQLVAEAKEEAWTFAVEHAWDLDAIREELVDNEAHRDDPEFSQGSMHPGASPRVHMDAYVATLKEAIEIIEVLKEASVVVV